MQIDLLNKRLSEPEFLLKKNWVISNVEFKLKMIDLELSTKHKRHCGHSDCMPLQ